MQLLNFLCCILIIFLKHDSFQIVSGISPFQFHVEEQVEDNLSNSNEKYVYIRGKQFLRRESTRKSKSNRVRNTEADDEDSTIPPTPSSWFSQCVDHLYSESESYKILLNSTCSKNKRWNQRFWINSKYYRPGGPIFFMFGGEGSAERFVDGGKWLQFAQDFGALATCLEHRFYGESFPTFESSFESMKLLSSKLALADAAVFIQWLKSNNSVFVDAKVVVFGGSYPGNLAAWMRQKYPEIVNAAVASSAPLEARFEFPEYYRTVSEVIYHLDQNCFWKILSTFRCMDSLVNDMSCNDTEAGSQFTSKYDLVHALHQCQSYNFSIELERQQLFHRLGTRWGSNYPGRDSASKCRTLENQTSHDVIVDYGNFLLETGQASRTCQKEVLVVGTEDEIVEFVKTLVGQARNAKSWIWQTCHEFGYFQVADQKSKLFSTGWNTLIEIWRCQSLFPDANFTRERIESGIQLTNDYYKGKKYDGSCTIFVNGQWDPWHSLGFNHQNETLSTNTVISIPEAEHCEDMKNDPTPSVFMYQAQQKIRKQIAEYLSDPKC